MGDLPHVYLSVEDAALWGRLLEDQEACCFLEETVDNPVDNRCIFVDKSVDSPVEQLVDGFVDNSEKSGICITEGYFVEGIVDS